MMPSLIFLLVPKMTPTLIFLLVFCAILNIITMPKWRNIPCNNPYKFCKNIDPIMERDRIGREEMVLLPCQATHQIKPRSLWVLENDNLYAIYSPHIKQDIGFLHKWLKTFVISNRAHFEESASDYLQSKGMS